MQLEINLPYSEWSYKLCGVYKITLDSGYFYIGCSENLRSRAYTWGSIFSGNCKDPIITDKFLEKISSCDKATFDIIELCDKIRLKDKEAFYLDKYKDDNLMVSYSANSWKPVLQHKIDGVFVKKHISVSEAARFNKSRESKIYEVLKGIRQTYKGMKFIYELDYQKPKRLLIRHEKKNRRNIVITKDNGESIVFKKISDAAKHLSCSAKNISRAASGIQRTARGAKVRFES